MKSRQKLVAAVIAVGLSLSLTACDPPMPEDLKIALAEKTILCESGLAMRSQSQVTLRAHRARQLLQE
jgi:hypothetical protein